MKKLLVLSFLAFLAGGGSALAYGSFQAPLTGGGCVESSGTVGTGATVELAAPTNGQVRQFLRVENPAATGGNSIAFTVDGSTPVVNGQGVTLYPGGNALFDTWVPQGAVTIIGGGAGSPWSICAG